jgi:hypothetical protein
MYYKNRDNFLKNQEFTLVLVQIKGQAVEIKIRGMTLDSKLYVYYPCFGYSLLKINFPGIG